MARTFIVPAPGCKRSAKLLANALGIKMLKLEGSRYRPRRNDLLINYGNSNCPAHGITKRINDPNAIAKVSNKLSFFNTITCIAPEYFNNLVPFTTLKEEALEWIRQGSTVYCRTKLTGHSGDGIVVAANVDELVDAPLYTKGIRKAREYRAHVFIYGENSGMVELLQQKKRRNNSEATSEIKNHHTGWVYATQNITQPPEEYENICCKVVESCGLMFGAVDFMVKDDHIYVLEVNTAPGLLAPSTLEVYKDMMLNYISEHNLNIRS